QRLRKSDLFKLPGVAETIDWANCLVALDRVALDPETVNNTLGVLLKYRDDLERVAGEEATRLVTEAKAAAAAEMGATSFLRRLLSGGQGGVDRRIHELLSLCESLLAESGEYASTALARDALAAYQALEPQLQEQFFDALARHYSPS